MKWNVNIAGRTFVVDLPDIIADGQSTMIEVDGQTMGLIWHKAARAFSLIKVEKNSAKHQNDKCPVEQQVQFRAQHTQRFEGESETKLALELRVGGKPGISYVQANVEAYAPGQGSGKTQKVAKDQILRSQITGKVLKVFVQAGDSVTAGQALLIIEAMKMENRIFAPATGKIQSISVKENDPIATGKELLRIHL